MHCFLALVCLLPGWAAPATGPDEPRVVIARAMKALGGREKLEASKVWKSSRKGYLGAGKGIPFTEQLYQQPPLRSRDEVHTNVLGMKTDVVEVFDKDHGWIEVNGTFVDLKGALLKEAKEAAHVDHVSRLTPLRGAEFQLSKEPEIKVDGRPARGVRVKARGHRDVLLYFDKETGLPVRVETKVMDPASGKEVTQERLIQGYVEFGGRKWPKKTILRRGGKKLLEMELVGVEVLDNLDDKLFQRTAVKRPQTPAKPYPYPTEEVSYQNRKAKVKFAGTLTLPRGKGPFPAVLLITGSGPQDRDETLMEHKPFLVLADYLTRQGIAVLRVDDRGVGGSTGKNDDATSSDFADDALAGVEFLKGRKEINSKQIGLIGHSEGGLIAPLAATRSKDVAFIVMLAGTGLPGDEVLSLQQARILSLGGVSEKKIAQLRAVQKAVIKLILEEKDSAALKKRLPQVIAEAVARLGEKDPKALEEIKSVLDLQGARLASPWFRYFLTYDPRPTLSKVRCPVLALNGSKDAQVLPKENLAAIEKALRAGGNRHFQVKELSNLNHLFQTCRTGAVSEYGQIEETMSPTMLKIVADWIREQTKPR